MVIEFGWIMNNTKEVKCNMEDFVQKPEDIKIDWIKTKQYEGSGYNAAPGEDPEILEKERESEALRASMENAEEK